MLGLDVGRFDVDRAVHRVEGHEGEENQEQEDSQGESQFEAPGWEQQKDHVEQKVARVEVREG